MLVRAVAIILSSLHAPTSVYEWVDQVITQHRMHTHMEARRPMQPTFQCTHTLLRASGGHIRQKNNEALLTKAMATCLVPCAIVPPTM